MDYRNYLRDVYADEKRRDGRFSYRAFAKRAGLPSPNHLKVVLDYGRPLTRRFLPHYARALRLSEEESKEFALLVDLGASRTEEARRTARDRLAAFRARRRYPELRREGVEDLERYWQEVLVLNLSRVRGFRQEAGWVSERLQGRLSVAEARRALGALAGRGFLRPRSRGRRATLAADRVVFGEAENAEIHRLCLGEAANPRTDLKSHGEPSIGAVVLRREEAMKLSQRLAECVASHLPDPGRRVKGELCLVIGEVVPISGPLPQRKTLTRRRNAASP